MEIQVDYLRKKLEEIDRTILDDSKIPDKFKKEMRMWLYHTTEFLNLYSSNDRECMNYFLDYFCEIFDEKVLDIIMMRPEPEKQRSWDWVNALRSTESKKIYFDCLILAPRPGQEELPRFKYQLSFRNRRIILYHILGIFYFCIDKNNSKFSSLCSTIKRFEESMSVPQNLSIMSFENSYQHDRTRHRLTRNIGNDHKTHYQREEEVRRNINSGMHDDNPIVKLFKGMKDIYDPKTGNINTNTLNDKINPIKESVKNMTSQYPELSGLFPPEKIDTCSNNIMEMIQLMSSKKETGEVINTISSAARQGLKKPEDFIKIGAEVIGKANGLINDPDFLEKAVKLGIVPQQEASEETISKLALMDTQPPPCDE